jgi:hypothetical protein
MHLVVSVTEMMSVAERAAVVVVMIGIAVMPIPVMRPAAVCVPPTGVVSPVPRTRPSIPCVAPEPIVDNRSENIYRLYDVVLTVHILVANYLNGYLVVLVFLYIYRGYILEDILRKNGL